MISNLLSYRGLHWLACHQSLFSSLKRAAFDAKHRVGQWGKGEAPEVGALVMCYAGTNGHVQVLGCGADDICSVIDATKLASIVCIDLSKEAIAHANQRYGTIPNVRFLCGNMSNLAHPLCAVTLFSESLYYLPYEEQINLLDTLGGTIIVTFANPPKHRRTIKMIRHRFNVIESVFLGTRLVLVFDSAVVARS